jgi:hypothetical protein
VLAALPLAALACNALTGVSDLALDPCVGGCGDGDAIASEGGGNRDSKDGAIDRDPDANLIATDAGIDAAARPSYCDGVIVYFRFDDSLKAANGITPDQPPNISFGPGKFGTSALSTAALYYVQGDGGVDYPVALEGSMATWFKPQWAWPTSDQRVFWKLVPDRTVLGVASAPYLQNLPTFFGSTADVNDGGTTTAGDTPSVLTPSWKALDWNHLAETWSKSSPTLTFTLNGASDDPTHTRRESNEAWDVVSSTIGFLRVGSNTYPLDGYLDDFALWKRVLSLTEIQALYSAPQSLGDTCGL